MALSSAPTVYSLYGSPLLGGCVEEVILGISRQRVRGGGEGSMWFGID